MIYINEKKWNRFHLNANNFYVVMDFDKTITSKDSLDSWAVIQNPNIVDPYLKKASLDLCKKYEPFESNYSLDRLVKTKYMEAWYEESMRLFYEYGLTYDQMLSCIHHGNIFFHNGVEDFLHGLHEANIPVVILSAGIGNVISEVLKLKNCLYDNIHIFSNFISFENGKMLPFKDPMIHTCNKTLPTHFYKTFSDKDFVLLFGDLIEDLYMFPTNSSSECLSFGFLEKNIDENFDFYRNAFDVVLTPPSSFIDICQMLKKSSRS